MVGIPDDRYGVPFIYKLQGTSTASPFYMYYYSLQGTYQYRISFLHVQLQGISTASLFYMYYYRVSVPHLLSTCTYTGYQYRIPFLNVLLQGISTLSSF